MSFTETIKFVEFWRFIAQELGDSQCRLNPKANRIKDLMASNSDHRSFLKDVIAQSYARCGCHHLKDSLDINVVLDVLGETAFSLQGENADDLLDIELLEEICWLTCQQYSRHIEMPQLPPDFEESNKHKKRAQLAPVVSLPNVKIRIANTQI